MVKPEGGLQLPTALKGLEPVFSQGHRSGRHCFALLLLTQRYFATLPPELRARSSGGRQLAALGLGLSYGALIVGGTIG